MTISEIRKELENKGLSPHELAEIRLRLAGEYSYLSEQLINVLRQKPAVWEAIRVDVKSDTQAERLWGKTELGQQEMVLRLEMKSAEKLLSAIKTKIDIALQEVRNQF